MTREPVVELAHVIALVKSMRGDCVDRKPHMWIRKKLIRAQKMLYVLLEREKGWRSS
jgi:hypothetical protein